MKSAPQKNVKTMWSAQTMQRIVFVLTTLMLASCATTTRSSDASFCAVAHPITWAQADTDLTIDQVKQHNARGVELCGWGES